MAHKIQVRRDTLANWTSFNPILSDGEIGYERGANKIKIGNGTSSWSTLPYLSSGSESVDLTDFLMVVEYPTGGPWPTRPDTNAIILWRAPDPTVGIPSTAESNDIVEFPRIEPLLYALSDNETPLSGTGILDTSRIPFACNAFNLRGNLKTASSSGNVQVDALINGVSILSTKLTIESGEKTSVLATTQPVFSTFSISDDDELSFSLISSGSGAIGLKVALYVYRAD